MKITAWLNRNIVGFSFASLFADFSQEIIVAVLPTFLMGMVEPDLVPRLVGVIGGLSDSAASFFKLFSGWLSDRWHTRKPFIIFGYILPALFLPLIGVAAFPIEILLYKTLAWSGKGFREPPRDALLSESIEQPVYGRAFGFQRAMDTFGSILGLITLSFLIHYFPIKTIVLSTFIPGILAVLAIVLLVKEPKDKAVGDEKIFGSAQFKQLPRSFIAFVCVMFIFSTAFFNKMLLLLRGQDVLREHFGPLKAAYYIVLLYALFNVVRALSEYSIGYMSDIYGRKYLLAFFGFGLFSCMSFGLTRSTISVPLLIVLFIAAGMSRAAVRALEKSYAADLLPLHVRGTGYGLLQATNGMSYLISSVVVGSLWSYYSFTVAFGYAAAVSFAATVLLILFVPKR